MARYNASIPSIDPGTFVNALAWDQLRREVAQRENKTFRSRSRAVERDPALAAAWSCIEGEAMRMVTPGEAYRIVLQDLGDSHAYSPISNVLSSGASDAIPAFNELETIAVDACFEQCDDWLISEQGHAPVDNYDQELGLLESVQQISLELQRENQGSPSKGSSCIIQGTESQREGQSV